MKTQNIFNKKGESDIEKWIKQGRQEALKEVGAILEDGRYFNMKWEFIYDELKSQLAKLSEEKK